MSPTLTRRAWLAGTLAGAAAWPAVDRRQVRCVPPPAASIIPVVGDGKWIWTEPPATEQGYLEPRRFEFEATMELTGQGSAQVVQATTAIPVAHPEQMVETLKVDGQGCRVQLRQVGTTAGQLALVAPRLARGQKIRAVARLALTLHKDFRGFQKEQFPEKQTVPRNLRGAYLGDSPGIQVHATSVRRLATDVAAGHDHPWDRARRFYEWVWNEIEARIGPYTNVLTAIEKRVGDCEERAAVFVALCRASGMAARLVWVPNHNWAEFFLTDESGVGRWIPVHTAAYSWFGWTGVHEMILQKGDKLRVPEQRRTQRLLADWMQWKGSRPDAMFVARLQPRPASLEEVVGPGGREKLPDGRWQLLGEHPLNRYLRDG